MHSRKIEQLALAFFALLGIWVLIAGGQAQKSGTPFTPTIPKTWDDEAIATLEVPLANPIGSPKHVSSEYYYRIPVRPVYKSYPVYAPGQEPPGYMEWLKQQGPQIVWDNKGHSPPLKSESDWIKAGEFVFDAPIAFDPEEGVTALEDVRNPDWYAR